MIWVEILSRHRDVTSRVQIAGRSATVGRGYDNDVIVDDPYVAPHHLRVSRGEAGELVAEDLGSANGTYLDGGKARITRAVIDGAKPLRIGQTLLRVRSSAYAVEPERMARANRRTQALELHDAAAHGGRACVGLGRHMGAGLAPSVRACAVFAQPCDRAGRFPRLADL
jgi:hypothetical protein